LVSCIAFASAGELPGYWTRLNYGAVAIKTKTVCLIDDYATHTIEIKLPTADTDERNDREFFRSMRPTLSSVKKRCQFDTITYSIDAESVSQSLERLYSLVPDSDEPTSGQRRKPRALFSLGGRIAHYLWNVATDANLEEVRKEINDQRLLSETALADGTRTRQAVAEFTQITNHRLSNMHAVLNEQQTNIAVIGNA
jgi:hypothetical protein